MSNADEKEIVKQAIKEWMDEQYAKFGKWALHRLAIAAITALLIWWASTHGAKLPF